jgi:hypothetical protein
MMTVPGSTTNLGEGELDTPDLTLITKTILADELQFRVPKGISDMNRASSDTVVHLQASTLECCEKLATELAQK